MELKVKNTFLKEFLNQYESEDDIKILSHLAIIGIDALKKMGIAKISYENLKKRAGKSH